MKENSVVSVRGTVTAGVYVNRIRNLQVISITVADTTGKLPVVWFNGDHGILAVGKGRENVVKEMVAAMVDEILR